jgi:hypothetical protein
MEISISIDFYHFDGYNVAICVSLKNITMRSTVKRVFADLLHPVYNERFGIILRFLR